MSPDTPMPSRLPITPPPPPMTPPSPPIPPTSPVPPMPEPYSWSTFWRATISASCGTTWMAPLSSLSQNGTYLLSSEMVRQSSRCVRPYCWS
ncbi:MAG TPA: hypothetical protein VIK02_01145 [Candidatus Anoxymicrobiaceae bacterium]